jgi:putative hydrolase of the HAD superfamily
MKRYSTMVFDVGGTLLGLDLDAMARAYLQAAATLGVTLDLAITRAVLETLELELPSWGHHRHLSLERDNGKGFWIDFYGEGFRRLGLNDVLAIATGITERFQRAEFEMLFDDVEPTLDRLAAKGVQLGIVSNFSSNLENVLHQLGIHRYFSFIVVSAIVNLEKPDPKIFDLALRTGNCVREDFVYIGDSIFHDIDGAHTAGLDAILLDRHNQHPDFMGARITSLRELLWEEA